MECQYIFFFVALDVVLNLDGATSEHPQGARAAARGLTVPSCVAHAWSFLFGWHVFFWGGQWIGFLEIGDFGDLKHRNPD